MKRTLSLLALALAACSLPVTVRLQDQTLNLPAVLPTGNQVLYKDPLRFDPPPVDVIQDVQVTGEAQASQTLNLTLSVYGRAQDPASNCTSYGDFYSCPADREEKLGDLVFQNQNQTTFTLKGEALTQGIKQGKLWLGVSVQGPLTGGVTLTLKNMQATVRVGF